MKITSRVDRRQFDPGSHARRFDTTCEACYGSLREGEDIAAVETRHELREWHLACWVKAVADAQRDAKAAALELASLGVDAMVMGGEILVAPVEVRIA